MPPHKPKVVTTRVTLPVLPMGGSATPLTVLAGVPNDNQLTLPYGGKYVYSFTSSAPVEVTLWGPFPNGVVDPTAKLGKGKMKLDGVSVTVGNTEAVGTYLLEVTSPVLATVELTVRPWNVWDNILQYIWKFTNK
jgi:hypothetical protein